jgi:hypothetical protein
MSYILPICLLILMIYISYRDKLYLISNYIIGFILVIYLTKLYFEGPLFKEAIPFFFLNIFFFSVVFASSFYIYFDKENDKKHYFLIPFLVFLVLAVLEVFSLRIDDAVKVMFLPVGTAFFPLYIIKYYKKY